MDLKDFVEQVFTRIQKWAEPKFEAVDKSLEDLDARQKSGEIVMAAELQTVKEMIPDVPSPTHIKDLVLQDVPVPEDGKDGEPGPEGPQGPQGEKGDSGQDGKSVSVDEIRGMLQGLVQKEVEAKFSAVPPPKDGRDGRDGKDGKDGKDGGKGADGLNGLDGKDGKDALHLDVLPEIDFQKSYPRGTFAAHNGGLWRAYQTTDKTYGWDCVVDGIAEVTKELLDTREIKEVTRMSSGKTSEIIYPAMGIEYKGVFKEETRYKLGDVVTWGGNIWHCDADETKDSPRNEKVWTLAVKKGRDGK